MKTKIPTGQLEFFCFTNSKNNTSQKSIQYRFLQDAIVNAVEVYLRETQEDKLNVQFAWGCPISQKVYPDDGGRETEVVENQEKRIAQYVACEPFYTFDRLILPKEKMDELKHAANLFKNRDLIFNTWGLKANGPFAVVAINLFGPSGSGKTLAAHAIAAYLGKKIIIASYGQIESMYHGEGPKNVEAIFSAAEKQDAVLFIDEADSLLSARIENPRQGSENAVNSMRSQILICLEKFNGIVFFATNLISNYDRAIKSRIRNIEFALPNEECRREIWRIHLPKTFPQDETVSIDGLAKVEGISGRDIRNAVQMVAEELADERPLKPVSQKKLLMAIEGIKRHIAKNGNEQISLTKDDSNVIAEVLSESSKLKGGEV